MHLSALLHPPCAVGAIATPTPRRRSPAAAAQARVTAPAVAAKPTEPAARSLAALGLTPAVARHLARLPGADPSCVELTRLRLAALAAQGHRPAVLARLYRRAASTEAVAYLNAHAVALLRCAGRRRAILQLLGRSGHVANQLQLLLAYADLQRAGVDAHAFGGPRRG